jgi:hypothetical protein
MRNISTFLPLKRLVHFPIRPVVSKPTCVLQSSDTHKNITPRDSGLIEQDWALVFFKSSQVVQICYQGWETLLQIKSETEANLSSEIALWTQNWNLGYTWNPINTVGKMGEGARKDKRM